MFPPPPDIETRAFATIPDELRRAGRPSAWLDLQRRGEPLGSFLEGPSFDREGNLYVVEIAHGRIFRIAPDGRWTTVAEYDGEPNGLKIHRDGRIFVADHQHGILELDPVNGRTTPFIGRDRLPDYKGVNDLFFAANGDLYFTDQGQTGMHDPTGRLYRYRADGRLDCLLDNVPSPNGLVMTPDETVIYLAVTRGNCVWRVPLLLNGMPSKVGIFVQLSGSFGGPDGLAMDEAGNLAVAHFGLGSVWQFDPWGEPIARIRSCAGRLVTNMAYGGPENRTLYITESGTGTVLAADLAIPGRLMYSHAG